MNSIRTIQPTDIDRLNLAARSLVTEYRMRGMRWASPIFSALAVSMAVTSVGSRWVTISVWASAALSVLATIALFAGWRYAIHFWALLFWTVAIANPYFHASYESGLIVYLASCGVFIAWGWSLWRQGYPFAATRGKEWQGERSRVREWFATLDGIKPVGNVLEVSGGSFWTGYFIYRLLHEGNCWAVAKFQKTNPYRPVDYRVRDASAVRISEVVDQRRVEIDGRLVGCAQAKSDQG